MAPFQFFKQDFRRQLFCAVAHEHSSTGGKPKDVSKFSLYLLTIFLYKFDYKPQVIISFSY